MNTERRDPTVLSGVPASPGSVTAQVRIVDGAIDALFPEGAVLVAHTTDPSLVRFMVKASAIVTEIGGRLSHTAIVAMELGIPCVVAVENALKFLTDGMLVRVDGDSGKIFILTGKRDDQADNNG